MPFVSPRPCLWCGLVFLSVAGPPATGQGAAQGAAAQGVEVMALTDLTFPTVFPGGGERVDPTDPGAAAFRVRGLRGVERRRVRITFSLPPALQTARGDAVPVAFGPESAAWADRDGGAVATFDPRQGLTVDLPDDGDFYVWLGGTATAGAGQTAGSGTSSVTLTATGL